MKMPNLVSLPARRRDIGTYCAQAVVNDVSNNLYHIQVACNSRSAADTLYDSLVRCGGQRTSQANSDIFSWPHVHSGKTFVIAAQSDVNATFIGCLTSIEHHDGRWFKQPWFLPVAALGVFVALVGLASCCCVVSYCVLPCAKAARPQRARVGDTPPPTRPRTRQRPMALGTMRSPAASAAPPRTLVAPRLIHVRPHSTIPPAPSRADFEIESQYSAAPPAYNACGVPDKMGASGPSA